MSDCSDTVLDLTDYTSLALAGVMQAAVLVHFRANGRSLDPAAAEALQHAVTTQDAQSVSEIFPRPADLRQGVNALVKALSGKPEHTEPVRYALELIDLARRLKANKRVVAELKAGLDALPPDRATAADLSGVYQATISTLGKRIQVTGDPQVLQRQALADEIRALLLAGVRFAWLWQQRGGRRWHLLARRARLLKALQALQRIL